MPTFFIISIIVIILFYYLLFRKGKTTYALDSYDFTPENIFDPKTRDRIIQLFKGQKLEKVFYVIANYEGRFIEFRGFHLSDVAVSLKFSNGEWLNWMWLETGFNDVVEYNIVMDDNRKKLNDGFNHIVEVTTMRNWIGKKGEILEDISFGFSEANGIRHLSDLKLIIGGRPIVLCATKEPDPNKLPLLEGLPFANDWTVIVFDDGILEKYNRKIV